MRTTIEKHQFGFSFMNTMTGGQRVHSFWGRGDLEASKIDARRQAEAYRRRYERELNEKAERRNRSCYKPSHIRVQIVGCSLWK